LACLILWSHLHQDSLPFPRLQRSEEKKNFAI
jgi:hypothetical protein